MTAADRKQLRSWAEAHVSAGSLQAAQVLDLLTERDELEMTAVLRLRALRDMRFFIEIDSRVMELKRLALAMAERIAAQSEIMSRKAERCVQRMEEEQRQ
jgi:hypothetical protein